MAIRVSIRRPTTQIVAIVLFLAGVGLSLHWWDRYVENALATWAADETTRRSNGAYHLRLSDLSFRPLAGSLSFDSASITTDSVNLRRRNARPLLRARAEQCRLSGVNVIRLLLRQSFDARALGCERVVGEVVLVPQRGRAPNTPLDTLDIRATVTQLVRPLGLSLFRIAEVSFPALSFTLRRPGPDGGASVLLERAELHMADLVFDPTVDPSTERSVAAKRAQIAAKGLVFRPDTLSEATIARLDADFVDSTLVLAGATMEPSMPDDEWTRAQRVRHDRIRFRFDSLAARGLAYRSFLAGGDLDMRAIELQGARLNVLSDKRLPAGPPPRHKSPQQAAAQIDLPFHVDTVLIANGRIVYLERKPEKERPGQISFDSVTGRILNLHLPSRGKRLDIEVRTRFMNAGLLSVHATVPLDAPDFRYELEGKLGPMSAMEINAFLAENESMKLANGEVIGIEFKQVCAHGRATTTITPRYRDLTFESASTGGGVIGSVGRAVAKFAANTFKVRSENPEDDGKQLHTAKAVRVYDPSKSWIGFLWFGLRDGLKAVIMK